MEKLSPRMPVAAFLEPWSEEKVRAWHKAHSTDWVQLMTYLREQGTSGRSWDARTSVVYKAMPLFVRAYQDAMYPCFLVAFGQHAGAHTSMKDAVRREENPIRQQLDAALPTYLGWFQSWRDQRNRVKQRTSVGFQSSPTELAVNFTLSSGSQATVSLSDIAEAACDERTPHGPRRSGIRQGLDEEKRAAVEPID
jgi:hypothetical protein